MRDVIDWARQGGPLVRLCTWGSLSMIVVGVISLVAGVMLGDDENAIVGALLALVGTFSFGALGWIRPRPNADSEAANEGPTQTCAACKAPIRPGEVHASLNIHLEEASATGITVHAAALVACYCRAACVRELWAHVEQAVPGWRSGDAYMFSETLTELRRDPE